MQTPLPWQLLPDLSAEEYDLLKQDIAARGVLVPVEYDENGDILDGHHRARACGELGIDDFPKVIRSGLSRQDKIDHVLMLNLARRHLTVEQRRGLVGWLRREENWSSRQIADAVGVDQATVVRDLAGDAYASPATVTGVDGKTYPAHRSPAVSPPEATLIPIASLMDDLTPAVVEEGVGLVGLQDWQLPSPTERMREAAPLLVVACRTVLDLVQGLRAIRRGEAALSALDGIADTIESYVRPALMKAEGRDG